MTTNTNEHIFSIPNETNGLVRTSCLRSWVHLVASLGDIITKIFDQVRNCSITIFIIILSDSQFRFSLLL